MAIAMHVENFSTKILPMSVNNWERHANPWCVWTRYICFPLLVLAVWSRIWIEWLAVVPVVIILGWILFTPKLFVKPKSTLNWASQSVLGVRALQQHAKSGIPGHHLTAIRFLEFLLFVGFAVTAYGLFDLHPYLTLIGTVIIVFAKIWFLDRMVWLYQDLYESNPDYQAWLY